MIKNNSTNIWWNGYKNIIFWNPWGFRIIIADDYLSYASVNFKKLLIVSWCIRKIFMINMMKQLTKSVWKIYQ